MDEISLEKLPDPEVPGRVTLKVAGNATISEAFTLREALLEALNEGEELLVDLRGVEVVDLTALQLICAAHNSAEKSGKRMAVKEQGDEIFRKVAADAGVQRYFGCSCEKASDCIWGGGEN